MMAWQARQQSNDAMVTQLRELNVIKSDAVAAAFRAVDRGAFLPPTLADEAYYDQPLRHLSFHQSAVHIYAMALDALELGEGLSFLNVGSGTGYLSSLAAYMCGKWSVHHGLELDQTLVDFAERSHAALHAAWPHRPSAPPAPTPTAAATVTTPVKPSSRRTDSTATADTVAASDDESDTDDGRSGSSASSSGGSDVSMTAAAAAAVPAPFDGAAAPLATVGGDGSGSAGGGGGGGGGAPFARVRFHRGNAYQLDVSRCMRYDRVYVGAATPVARAKELLGLLSVGGILVAPVGDELIKVRRVSAATGPRAYAEERLAGVRFAPLARYPPAPAVLPRVGWCARSHRAFPTPFKQSARALLLSAAAAARNSTAAAAEESDSDDGSDGGDSARRRSDDARHSPLHLPPGLLREILSFTDREWFVPAATAEEEAASRKSDEATDADTSSAADGDDTAAAATATGDGIAMNGGLLAARAADGDANGGDGGDGGFPVGPWMHAGLLGLHIFINGPGLTVNEAQGSP